MQKSFLFPQQLFKDSVLDFFLKKNKFLFKLKNNFTSWEKKHPKEPLEKSLSSYFSVKPDNINCFPRTKKILRIVFL